MDQIGLPPALTVVITTRDRRVWLEQALESVRGQQGVVLQIVVIDDASSDGTWDWLLTVSDSRVEVIRLPVHSERSTARNLGLAEARGAHVMFLDDDDWLEPCALQALTSGLSAHPEAVAAVGARRVWITTERHRRRDTHPRVSSVRDVMDELLAGWSAGSGQNLFRTALVRQVGGYDPALNVSEDRDLWLRLAVLGPVVLCPQIVTTVRLHRHHWRPPDIQQIRERVGRRAIRALPAARRRHALRLRRTACLLDQAEVELTSGRLSKGFAHALGAAVNTPAILTSPLMGPWVLRRLAGRLVRRWLKRQP